MTELHRPCEGPGLSRRFLLQGAASAAALAALVPPALAANFRGVVGCLKPRAGDPSLADMIRMLPRGIGIIPAYLDLQEGTREELSNAFPIYEKNIDYLAKHHCDLISIEGAPPFMLLGPEGETKLVEGWKQKYKTDMFTSSQNQVNVLRALKIKKILGITAFKDDLNKSYAKYFEDCGIGVVAMAGIDVAFANIPEVPAESIYKFIKQQVLKTKGIDGIYILGSGLDAVDIIEPLEQDLGLPVVQPVAARVWEIQKRLHVHQPVQGYGVLLESLPT